MRDPKVDPKPGDVLRWVGDNESPIICTVADVQDHSVDVCMVNRVKGSASNTNFSHSEWRDWREVGGPGAVMVLWTEDGAHTERVTPPGPRQP